MAGALVIDVTHLQTAQVRFRALIDTVGPSLEAIVGAAQTEVGSDHVALEFIDRLNDQRRRFQSLAEVFNQAITQLDRDIVNIEQLKSKVFGS